MVLWKDNLKIPISRFSFITCPWTQGVAFHLNKLEFPLFKDALFHVWLKLVLLVLRRSIVICFFNVFLLFCFIPLEKRLGLICSNLNSLHPSRFCAKFRWNWPIGSWEDYFCNLVTLFVYEKILFKFVGVFLLFRNYLFLEKIVTQFHLYRGVIISGEGL